jgi:hypothetical protein
MGSDLTASLGSLELVILTLKSCRDPEVETGIPWKTERYSLLSVANAAACAGRHVGPAAGAGGGYTL